MDVCERRLKLVAAGFVPLPLHGKVPPVSGKNNAKKGLAGWQNLQDVTSEMIEMWSRTWPDARNTGCLTRQMPALDLDILNEEAVRAIEGLVRERFEERGHVLVRIGKPPKRAILFRTDEPFAKVLANVTAPNGQAEKVEFLGDGQQLACFGTHPETRKLYRWHGGEPGSVKHEDLPDIREEGARALVTDIVTLLVRDFGYRPAAERPKNRRKSDGAAASPPDGAADWQYLYDNIRAGRALHDSLRDLAAKLVAAGTGEGAAINQLRALLQSSSAPRDARWQERYGEIPGLVESAIEKYAKGPDVALEPKELAEVHAVFRNWLDKEYDMDVIDAVLAAAASQRLRGDPLWLLVISGPGNAKTETVQALSGAGAHVTSTISSEGALLSATPRRDKSKQATGGLLRKLGNDGVLVIKDVTSILSADRTVRQSVLAAIREIYDGRWERNVGTEGGRTLTWTGRITIVGAVTTAWDAAHSVVAQMGDRFVIVRADSKIGRARSATKALRNTGSEVAMRAELAQVVGGLISSASKDEHQFSDDEIDRLVKAANIVTSARTAVERDYKGDIVDAHAPEMPTRFAKQLAQLVRGARAIGTSIEDAMRLAIRCARDSIPPLRREILLDVAANPSSRPRDVHRRIGRPRSTVRRELEALYMLRLLQCDETDEDHGGKMRTLLHYSLAADFDRDTLLAMTRGP